MKVCQMSFRSNNNDKIQWQDKSDTNIRAGWLMTGLTIPPMKIFFPKRYIWRLLGYTWARNPLSGTLFRPFRCIQQHLAIARCIQVYSGVSKKHFLAEGWKFFFLTGLASPPLKFFSANCVYQNDFLKEPLVKCVI